MDFIGPHHVASALAPDADRWNADPATDVFNMENYGQITFIIDEGAGAVGTTVITVEECTAADGTGATAIAFNYRVMTTTDTWGARTATAAAGFTTTAGANNMYVVEVDASALSDGSNFVRIQTTESADGAVDASIFAILTEARYPQDVPVTAIS